MTVTNINTDKHQLTLTVDSQYDAPIETVWQLWADPRLLERWWGPPSYPATFTQHDFRPGGTVKYYMTGPEGDVHGGWWQLTVVDEPNHIEFEDGFLDKEGKRNDAMPTVTIRIDIAESEGRVTVTSTSWFQSLEAMEQLIEMGMEEGIRGSMGQIDELLASLVA